MTFEIYDADGKLAEADKILSYELVSEVSAACDGLQLKFIPYDKIHLPPSEADWC